MFPAEALARELLARGQRVVLVTDRRGKAFGDALPEVEVHRIRASSFGSGIMGKIRGVVELTLGALPGPPADVQAEARRRRRLRRLSLGPHGAAGAARRRADRPA